MKTLILILFFMINSLENTIFQSSQSSIIDGDIYIYEYAMKKPNQIYIGFIIINNNRIVQNLCYTIELSKGKVENIIKEDINVGHLQYLEMPDGNILIKNSKLLCYSSKNFKYREKRIPNNIYKEISPLFLVMTNKERFDLLNEIQTINKKH
ncbi:hypothetical protein JMN11_13820 [Capnocytophaga genosp. AHN8471]|jgi:FNIP repeat-containing protein R636|uniref:hypothetical protein n=1 Tax=Capnocytophaga genosp. AHN8471 TaxID=327574 RepID=UPI001933B1C4|nr:hypothetical protein [Capnocytophaga genosp. AHN8471]MBM0654726.1 hypothetical protein [Capnocytophaga genosp. AHN8471]